jgi:hypothetical protein
VTCQPRCLTHSSPTTYSSTLSGGAGVSSSGVQVSGNANVAVAALVALGLLVLLSTHLLGFRWGFDASVGRK